MNTPVLFGFIKFPLALFAVVLPLNEASAAGTSSLEDEMFGSTPPSSSGASTSNSSESQSANSPSSSAMRTTSDVASEALIMGGRLELQTNLLKSSKQSLGDAPTNHSAAAELYLDTRPNDSLRGFIKGSLNHLQNQKSDGQSTQFSLYELWIKWGGQRSIYTTLGKQKLKWGAASFWNPTDFLSVENKDPLAAFDVRPGANLIKVHYPLEKLGHNFYTVVDLQNSSTANSPRIAARGEFNYGFGNLAGELTATVAGGKDQPTRFGLDLSTALGPIDLIVESAWTRRSQQTFFRKMTSETGAISFFETTRDREVIPQIVTGLRYDLKYSESDSANLNLEYFWNDAGYGDVALEAYSFVQGQSNRLYLANRYLAASLFLNQPGELNNSSILLSALSNLTDNSWLLRTSYTERIDTRSRIEFAVTQTGGVGEFTGGLPEDIANKLKNSGTLPKNATDTLDRIVGVSQNLTLSVTAGIDL